MILQEARCQIQKNNYPSEFDPDSWKTYLIDNCYTYALDLKLSDLFLIGDFIGKRVTRRASNDLILSVLLEELDTLGFYVEEIEIDTICDEFSQKIFLGRDSTGEYHFIREDLDGLWSHKSSTFLPTRINFASYTILDPQKFCETYETYWCFQLTKKEQ